MQSLTANPPSIRYILQEVEPEEGVYVELILFPDYKTVVVIEKDKVSLCVLAFKHTNINSAYYEWKQNPNKHYVIHPFCATDTSLSPLPYFKYVTGIQYSGFTLTFTTVNKKSYSLEPYLTPYFYPMSTRKDVVDYIYHLVETDMLYHFDDDPIVIFYTRIPNGQSYSFVSADTLQINHTRMWDLCDIWALLDSEPELSAKIQNGIDDIITA